MAQIDILKFEDASGNIHQVPVHELDDFSTQDGKILRVQTTEGVGAIALKDPSDATFPELRIRTHRGLKAFHELPQSLQTITVDAFESGDLAQYSGAT